MPKQEVVKKETTQIAKPSTRGFEEPMAQDDMILPFANLLQALSPDVIDGIGRPGIVINSLTKETLPGEFIPIFKFTNYVRFNPRDNNARGFDPNFGAGEIVWRSTDSTDPRVIEEIKFGPNGERPIATKFLNFFSYFPGSTMPVIVRFANSSINAGRALMTMAKAQGGDMFRWKYRLTSKQDKNDKGTFFVFKVEMAGPATEEEYKYAEGLWDTYHLKNIEVHSEAEPKEDKVQF